MAYQPLNVPEDAKDIPGFLQGELRRVMRASATPYLQLDVYHRAPDKPREGMIVCADGADWDPGSGAGFYGFLGGAWVALIPPPAPDMAIKIKSQIFTSSGTFTPSAKLIELGGGCFVRVIGGGGGGGGGGSGGVGDVGGSSSIGGLTARGGYGGGGGANPFGGIGRVNGSAGYDPNGGIGGDAGGPSSGPGSVGADAPSNSGAGGCGGGNNYSGNGGGGGGSGTVEESPLVITSATSVTVGAGGSGGSSSGKAGGAGGSGKVMVWWYE